MQPIVLGIETSCDETAIGIVRGRTLLANGVRVDSALYQLTGDLVTVQINGHTGNRDMRQAQDHKKDLPARKAKQAMGQPVNCRVQNGPVG